MSIVINVEELKIRPSSIEGFYSCAYQWARTFLGGESSIPNARAAIGTAIHAAAEAGWNESISSKKKVMNKTMMKDAAIESWKESTHGGVNMGKDNEATAVMDIMKGTDAFIDDIVPYSSIPDAVELYFEVPIDNPFVKSIGGTVDYIVNKTIADLKTSKRKTGPEGHVVQQSAYRWLANANGYKVDTNLIQQVVIKAHSEGAILHLDANIDQFKYLVNGMLDTLDLVAKDVAPIETILRPNPKHIFCSKDFCAFHSTCPAIKGEMPEPTQVITKVKL